jgi:hypothetical protein
MNTIGALLGIYVAFRLIREGIVQINKLED